MLRRLFVFPSAAIVMAATTGSVYAAFDATMYSVGSSLSSFATLNQSLDIASTTYNYPIQAGFVRSGHVVSIGPPSQTGLVTNVYTVTQASTFSKGANSVTLNPGDMVWAYTITLVDASTQTVKSLQQFQAGGGVIAPPPGTDLMDASLIIGRGFSAPAAGVLAPTQELAGDLEEISFPGGPVVHAALDWDWVGPTADQLGNSQTITLLMFTHAANIGNGIANMLGNPGQQAAGSDPNLQAAPILIPIAIPAPGSGGVLIGGFALLSRRRRR